MSTIAEGPEEEYEESPDEYDDDGQYDEVIEFDLEDYEDNRANTGGDAEGESGVTTDGGTYATEGDGTEVDSEERLHALESKRLLNDEEKSKRLCFKFYRDGQCTEAGCKYSHDRELAYKRYEQERVKLESSPFKDRNKAPVPKKPAPGPKVTWTQDAVNRSNNPRLNGGGRGGGRGTPNKILKRG